MIDKLKLWTTDFEIETENSLKVKRGDYNFSNGKVEGERCLFYINREPVFGKSAYFNNEELHYSVDINDKGLFVNFNPSIAYYGFHNFYTITNYQLRMVMDWIKEDIKKQGINLTLDNMDISRIDLCRNAEVKYPVIVYSRVFSWLRGKRMDRINYIGTYAFRNNSREVVFYDKLKEIEEIYGVSRESLGLSPDVNIMRGELRFRNKRVVKSNLGISRVSELYDREVYEELSNKYKVIVGDVVFHSKVDKEPDSLPFKGEVEVFKYFESKYGRSALSEYKKVKGVENLIMDMGSLENYKEFLRVIGYSRRGIYKELRKIQEELKSLREVRRIKDSIEKRGSFQELYNELYEKFCK